MDENFVKTWSQKDFHEIAASFTVSETFEKLFETKYIANNRLSNLIFRLGLLEEI